MKLITNMFLYFLAWSLSMYLMIIHWGDLKEMFLLLIIVVIITIISMNVRTRHIKRTEEGEVRILLSFLQNILEALVIGSANSKELNNHIMNRKDTLNRGCAKEEGEK